MKLPVTLAHGMYDRVVPLLDGTVSVDGVDLNLIPSMPMETFERQARHAEFDAAEFSLATLMILHSRGDDRLVGLPVFPSRRFRHEHIWINVHSGISDPQDLAGRRIGVQEFVQTAAVWIRGFLSDDYGLSTEGVQWYLGGYNEPIARFTPRISFPSSHRIQKYRVPDDDCIDAMLERGELDAAFPTVPRSFQQGSPHVRRLFPEFQSVERDYYQRTGIFPIMHVVVIKRSLYEQSPWVARSLYKAFELAKLVAMTRMRESPPLYTSLPWLTSHISETEQLMGVDYWSYGLEADRHVLETLARYAWEQGILDQKIEVVDDLFAAECRDALQHVGDWRDIADL